MIISKTGIRNFEQGLRAIFFAAMHGAEPKWGQFCQTVPSVSAEEIYRWLGALPGMRKMNGQVQVRNVHVSDFSIANEEWEDTIGIKEADFERDRVGTYSPLVAAMGASAAQHKDELLADLLINGFTALDYTGSAYFASNKVAYVGATAFSNVETKKISRTNYRAARKSLRARVNAQGRPMNLGRDLVLVVSPTYEEEGREILLNERVGGGNTNVDRGTARLEIWPQLSASGAEHAWFLFDLGHPVKPFVLQDEKSVDVSMVMQDDSYVVLNHEYLWQAYGRYGMGYLMPELAWGSDGTTAA